MSFIERLVHHDSRKRTNKMKLKQAKLKKGQQGGFTLIEMAMVLVIIGLILGAISIGKDLQRNAEYAKVKQKFIDQWAQAYNQYYYKTGVVLADSQIAPTLAINALSVGEINSAIHNAGISNYADLTAGEVPARICFEDANVDIHDSSYTTIDPALDRTATTIDLHDYFDIEGIEMPPGRAEGREDRYIYLDTNGNPQEIQICFQWNPPKVFSNSGNVMVIKGLTPDIARMLDQMIDGKADAREGLFREEGIENEGTPTTLSQVGSGAVVSAGTDPGEPGREWGAINREEFTTEVDQNFDEDQVITITAHYKMNQ